MTKSIKPLKVLEIYEGDIIAEADDIQEGVQLTNEQITRIMEKVKEELKNDEGFFEYYWSAVNDCIREELNINE